jgi:hypothetical protein
MNDKTLTNLIYELDNHIHFTMASRVVKKEKSRMSFEAWLKILTKLCRFAGTKKALKMIGYMRD